MHMPPGIGLGTNVMPRIRQKQHAAKPLSATTNQETAGTLAKQQAVFLDAVGPLANILKEARTADNEGGCRCCLNRFIWK